MVLDIGVAEEDDAADFIIFIEFEHISQGGEFLEGSLGESAPAASESH